MLSAGLSFTIYATFDWQSWVLCVATGISTVCSSTIRFKSLKLAPASALQKLIPLMTLFQWVFDVSLFHVYYTPLQDIALAYLFLLYLYQGLKYALYDSKKKAEKKVEKDKKREEIKAAKRSIAVS